MAETEKFTTLFSVAALIADAIEHYGLDSDPIVREAGIDPKGPYSPNDRLPVKPLQRLWRLAALYTGDPCFGLTYAAFIQPAALHGLGLAWAASDNLANGLHRLVRYQRIISTSLDIRVIQDPGCYQVIFHTRLPGRRMEPVSVDATLAAFLRMCRIIAGPDIRPTEVLLDHVSPECTDRFHAFFACPVEFGARDNRILFSRKMLEHPLSTAHPGLARANDAMVIDYLRHFDRSNLSTQVRARIIENLPDGMPTQASVARSLNLSLRNLQRKLHTEGTSFKALMEETRKELALQYLRGSNRPILEIAFLLGFSETSNFSRAFRRWVGISPKAYRDTLH